jgi:ELWxxDGT repeat protein
MDGTLYFMAAGGHNPMALWKVNPGGGTSVVASFAGPGLAEGALTSVNNTLYFNADDPANPNQLDLWKSDGTSAGTSVLFSSGLSSQGENAYNSFYNFNDILYFNVPTSGAGEQLYRTDGTAAGTEMLFTGQNILDLTAASGKLYFIAQTDGYGDFALYTTNGSPEGTTVVDGGFGGIGSLLAVNNQLYFIATTNNQAEIWQTDGTTTTLVDSTEASSGWTPYTPLLAQTNNTVLFAATDAQHGTELWGVPVTPSATVAFAKDDATTSGNWTGTYGSDGYTIVGGSTNLPGYVSDVWYSYPQYWQWAAEGQADYLAPQIAPNSSVHVAASYYAASSFTVHFDLTDGQVHQVAFYLLDYDYQARVETVQVANGDSGQVLDTRTVSNFETGQYLVYDLSGNVAITFTNAGRPNAVLSAILFDPTAAKTAATFAGVDISTQGHWTGVYGSQGYDVIGGSANLPNDVDFSINGEQFYTWAGSTTDPRALQTSPGSSTGVAACAYSNASSFTINLDFLDNNSHQVALYLLDYDYQSRFETIQISNALTGAILDTEPMGDFTGGWYARWDVSGDIQITISNHGGLNEVVSGIFIGPPTATATYVKQDYATQGNYTGVYGKDGYDVFNATASLPSYATLNIPSSVQNYTWSTATTSPAALQDAPGSTARIAACDYSNSSSFTFNVDLTDGKTHQVALYFLDYDNQHRSEILEESDASTGIGLGTSRVVNFVGGDYIVLDLSGDVGITITNSGGLNEVLSGIFFG